MSVLAPYQFWTLPEVRRIVGLGKTRVYALVAAGTFPAPVKIGARCSRWRSDAVMAWMDAQQPVSPLRNSNAPAVAAEASGAHVSA